MGGNVFRVKEPKIFSFEEILWFLDRNYDDCLFEVSSSEVLRLVKVNGNNALLSIHHSEGYLEFQDLLGEVSAAALEPYVRSWFDLDRDLQAFYKLLDDEPFEHFKKDYYGLRLIGIPDLLESLSWCIIGQQINLNFAYKLKRALVEAYGEKLVYNNNEFYHFPSAEDLGNLNIEDLKRLQFSRQKAEYLIGIAQMLSSNKSYQSELNALSSEGRNQQLLSIRGIGEWTANYVQMKTFGDVNCIPFGDTGLQQALFNYGVISDKKDFAATRQFVKKYDGWGSYLTTYLWRSLKAKSFT